MNMQAQRLTDWIKKVSQIMENQIGIGVDDIPDYDWADLFDAGYSPKEAYLEWFENEGMDY